MLMTEYVDNTAAATNPAANIIINNGVGTNVNCTLKVVNENIFNGMDLMATATRTTATKATAAEAAATTTTPSSKTTDVHYEVSSIPAHLISNNDRDIDDDDHPGHLITSAATATKTTTHLLLITEMPNDRNFIGHKQQQQHQQQSLLCLNKAAADVINDDNNDDVDDVDDYGNDRLEFSQNALNRTFYLRQFNNYANNDDKNDTNKFIDDFDDDDNGDDGDADESDDHNIALTIEDDLQNLTPSNELVAVLVADEVAAGSGVGQLDLATERDRLQLAMVVGIENDTEIEKKNKIKNNKKDEIVRNVAITHDRQITLDAADDDDHCTGNDASNGVTHNDCTDGVDDDDGDEDDDDDERDLTSLTWLTELRNQNLSWTQTHQTLLDGHDDDSDDNGNDSGTIVDSRDAAGVNNSNNNSPNNALIHNDNHVVGNGCIGGGAMIPTADQSNAKTLPATNTKCAVATALTAAASIFRKNAIYNRTNSKSISNKYNNTNNNNNNGNAKNRKYNKAYHPQQQQQQQQRQQSTVALTQQEQQLQHPQRQQQTTATTTTTPAAKRPTPAERYDVFIKKIKNDLLEYEQLSLTYQNDSNEKPPFHYSHIIAMAMLENGRVTLQQICNWIKSKFAYFRVHKKWNNSIRHNLSLHYCFRKIDRKKYEKGKGGYWELGVDLKKCDRKRIRNRKAIATATNMPLSRQQQQLRQKQQQQQQLPIEIIRTQQNTHLVRAFDRNGNDRMLELEQQQKQEQKQQQQQISEYILDDLDMQEHFNAYQHYTIQQSPLQQQTLINDFVEQQQQQQQQHIDDYNNTENDDNGIFITNGQQLQSHQQQQQGQYHDEEQQQQYQLGTIIISTMANSDDMLPTATATCNVTNDNFTTLLRERVHIYADNTKIQEQLFMEDEIPAATENVIISSYLMSSSDAAVTTPTVSLSSRRNVIVEQLTHPTTTASATISSIAIDALATTAATTAAAATTNYNTNNLHCSIVGDNYRPYIDGIDEAFQYLRSMDTNREDILDNLLDISVSDY